MNAKLYAEHVAAITAAYGRALAASGFDAALVHSGSLLQKTIFDDQYWPLRTTPHFQHFLPLAEPDCYLLVRGDRKPGLIRPKSTSFWETSPVPPAPYMLDAFEAIGEVADIVKGNLRVAFVGEHVDKSLGFARDEKLMLALDAIRTKKTRYEIACLAEANAIAARGHVALKDAFDRGETNELRLHLLFLETTQQDDPETPYKNIVASGKNAATLHHVTYRKDASGAPSLLVDAGATFHGYCSDITRTHVRSGGGAGADAFAALVKAVDAMQTRLVARARAGDRYEALHDESHKQTSAILRDIGIVKSLSVEETDAKGISRAFYPHGLGHSLGLQTHDVGCALTAPRADNPFLRNTSIIERDQVFTIEPGVYFIDSLLGDLRQKEVAQYIDWSLVEALAPLGGVRIEDDVLVAEGAVRNFTREVLP